MIWRHGVRAAITPIVTVLGLDIGILLGGAILTETVFNIPGIGRYAYDGIINADLPVIQGTVLFGAFFIVVANLVVDILYALPRPAGALLASLSRCSRSRTCTSSFDTEDGVVHAVDGISYASSAGKTLGIVGESGSGKSVTGADVMGLTRARNARITGRGACSTATTCSAMSEDELRTIRGNDIAMIFQDPLSSLHPFYTVGPAARRGRPRAPRRLEGRRPRPRRGDALAGRHPGAAQARSTPTRTSSRAACASA